MKASTSNALITPPILALLEVATPVSRGARPPSGVVGCAPRPTWKFSPAFGRIFSSNPARARGCAPEADALPETTRHISSILSQVAFGIASSILALLAAVTPVQATPVLEQLAAHNVVWDSPSADMHGSMPIGNGDLAANFWVEPSGDLVFYLSKSDSWDADQELLKLGRVRIRLDKPFVRDGCPFRQELDLARGCIVVESGVGDDKTTVDFWIDANRPVVNIQIKGAEAFTAQVTLEHWPKETYTNRPTQSTDIAKTNAAAAPEALRGDTILPAEDNTIRWCYRNTTSIFADTLKNQHLGHAVEKFHDPLLNLTFGGLIAGEGLVTKDDRTLATAAPVKTLDIRIHAFTAQTPEAAAWISQLEAIRAANDQVAASEARPAHEQWWKNFWNRSWIFPEGTEDAKAVGRAYALQRWIQAGASRGAYPIKFNGSLFTVDGFMDKKGVLEEFGPDWRRWGGCYWFQNTREPYWAMLYSGDYDQMEPLWKMYREAVPLLKERTKTYFKHDGIFCSETIHPWGLNKQGDFGYDNPDFYPTNRYIRLYWDSGIELSQMMLDRYEQAPSEEFAKTTLVPIADGVVTFYEQHYPKPEPGKPRFTPSMSLETWHTAEDPLPVIVGLRTVLTRMLELPESLSTPEQRAKWTRFLAELPETPMAEENGKKWMLPARTFSEKKNSENPELYAVFPYRAYTVGKPGLDVALETWRRRLVKRTGGWSQDPIQAAMLGLTQEAKDYVVTNATDRSPIGKPVVEPRFPAFWGPNFDWTPDQDHGAVTLIALQRMLMLCDGDAIRLLPAWPQDWYVSFKLHAPYQTIVEGRVENGKLTDLKVTPETRRKDVVIGDEFK